MSAPTVYALAQATYEQLMVEVGVDRATATEAWRTVDPLVGHRAELTARAVLIRAREIGTLPPDPEESPSYVLLRDTIIERLNPPDGEDSEESILQSAVERIATFVVELPCQCTSLVATFDDDPCGRCYVLGRRADQTVDP